MRPKTNKQKISNNTNRRSATKRLTVTNRLRTRKRSNKTKSPGKSKLQYVHPSLYQKQNDYGLGTYTKSFIPENTIIIKEKPHNLTHITNEDPHYIILLIKHLLKNNPKEFLSIVPTNIDDQIRESVNYDTIKEGHQTHLPELSEDDMKLYYTKYRRNAFKFGNNPGFLFYGTRLNHSCEPNVSYYPSNEVMIFKTKRDIHPEEEIFDSYINYNQPKMVRQSDLKRRYGFDCGCTKCNTDISV
jgi:hypothetical protein